MWAAIASVVLAACATPSFTLSATVDARYRCDDGSTLAVRLDNRADTATVT